MKDISEAEDPDLRGSVAAMHHAAALARETAIRTNTCLVIVENGRIVHIPAHVLRAQSSP